MSEPIVLRTIELVPVIALEPYRFATQACCPSPLREGKEGLDEWGCYWRDALAEAGITGLWPIRSRSWHVATTELTDLDTLRTVLEATLFQDEGIESLAASDSIPALDGGLALCGADGEVLVEPTCCADLDNLSEWQVAARHRGREWQAVWIGHPWVSVRFEEPWLVLTQPDESASRPEGKWIFRPEQLERALAAAESELEVFAGRLASVLQQLGYPDDPWPVARGLAGLRGCTA
jgi:hypothetical protein